MAKTNQSGSLKGLKEMVVNFLGELQSADGLSGPWNDVTNVSPYSVSATNAARFYRATEQ